MTNLGDKDVGFFCQSPSNRRKCLWHDMNKNKVNPPKKKKRLKFSIYEMAFSRCQKLQQFRIRLGYFPIFFFRG